MSIADASFWLLVTGPSPLALPLAELVPASTCDSAPTAPPGLTPAATTTGGDGVIALDELRTLLCHADTTVEVKNTAWSALVTRSQTLGGAWTVGAVGVALPRLVRLAASLAGGDTPGSGAGGGAADRAGEGGFPRITGGARVELDAEVLTGFLAGLAGANPAKVGLFPHLLRCARRAGVAWLRHQRGADTPLAAAGFESMPPPAPAGHPDLVLARAIAAGVVSVDEARLIGTTRIENISVTALAARLGVEVEALWKRRRRAEQRLAAYLHDLAHASDPGEQDTDPTSALALADTPITTTPQTTQAPSRHRSGDDAGRGSRGVGHGVDVRQAARDRRAARRSATLDAARNAAARRAARRDTARACPETGPTAPSYRCGTSPAISTPQSGSKHAPNASTSCGRGRRGHTSTGTSR